MTSIDFPFLARFDDVLDCTIQYLITLPCSLSNIDLAKNKKATIMFLFLLSTFISFVVSENSGD